MASWESTSQAMFARGSAVLTGMGGRVASYWIVGFGLAAVFLVVRNSTWQSSAQLHTVMEAIATVLALVVGGMALARFYSKKNNTFLFIGAAFLGTSFLDGFHAVVTSEFFSPLLPSDLPSLITLELGSFATLSFPPPVSGLGCMDSGASLRPLRPR